jgi:hypothetical protein
VDWVSRTSHGRELPSESTGSGNVVLVATKPGGCSWMRNRSEGYIPSGNNVFTGIWDFNRLLD